MLETSNARTDEEIVRARLQQQITQVIDGLTAADMAYALDDEAVTAQAPPAPDLMTLLTEMASLRQEVRLQRREIVKLRDMLRPAASQRQDDDEAMQRAMQSKLAPFLDVRDALARASARQAEALAAPHSVWQRFVRAVQGRLNAQAAPAVVDAAILLQQIDWALAQVEVVPLDVVGEAFDPETMVAVSTTQSSAVAPGAVVQQVVGGYRIAGRIWRPAQVVVNQAIL